MMTEEEIDYAAAQDGVWYLGSPYGKYPLGLTEAFEEACRCAGWLMNRGVTVFCPIAHSHPIAIHGGIEAVNHAIWIPADIPIMHAARGLIVAQMPSWETSYGISKEIEAFHGMDKPVYYLEWPRTT